MRFVPIAAAAAALMFGAGAAQAALYCDPQRPFVCIDQPDPPAPPPGVTYVYPPPATYTYQVEPPKPPPQVTYHYQAQPRYEAPQYQAPPPVAVQPQPVYTPRPGFSVHVD